MLKEAKAKGMTDAEIEKIALENGYTLSSLQEMRGGVSDVNEKVIQEHALEKAAPRQMVDPVDDVKINQTPDTPEDVPLFGSSFFSTSSASFEPDLRIATPLNYILGPDDEFSLDLSGKYSEIFRLRVSPEGTVRLLNFPPIFVSGLTVDEAKKRILSKLGTAYSGGGVYANVSLDKIRSIKVTVVGKAKNPGTYTLSSLATVFHALHVSGGPSLQGTFREIEVIRQNKSIRKIDLYKYITAADASDNIMLQDQDVVLIKPYNKRIKLTGEVKTPAFFEAVSGETLQTIIDYAGGYTPEAYTFSVNYRRNTGKEYKVGHVPEASYGSFELKNGDRFEVGKILERFENRVTISGAVYRGGDYALEPGLQTVSQLIKKADGVAENAFLNRGLIQRLNEHLEPVNISFDVRKLLKGEIEDIQLRKNDVVIIKSIQDLKEAEDVEIYGEIIKSGKYKFFEGMTVEDLVFLAGGYTYGAIPYRVEVSRRVKEGVTEPGKGGEEVKLFELTLSDDLSVSGKDKEFALMPFDIVVIRRSQQYKIQKHSYVLGEVNYPGGYVIKSNFERISDLITKSGGLKEEAYLKGAQFRRDGHSVALDVASILEKPDQPSNLLLFSGDTLIIPRKQETVEVFGDVLNPSFISFDPGFNYRDYLSQAGGYTKSADKNRVFVTYSNGITKRTKRPLLIFRKYPKIEPGSRITVTAKLQDTNNQKLSSSERVMIISAITTFSLTIIRILPEIFNK